MPSFPAAPAGAKITNEGWFAPPKRSRPLPPLPETVTKAFVIPIREEITQKTYYAFKRKLARCIASGAELIVVDMNTPGGGLFAGMDIAQAIKIDAQGTRVVCYVRPETISAGSMIGLACDEIVMVPVGKLGDCGVIFMGGRPAGMPPDKILTYVRTEFRQSAQMHGYNDALCQKMVDPNKEAWLVRNKTTRELQYVLRGEYRGQVTIPPGLSDVPSNPAAQWELLRIVVPIGNLFTMTTAEAVKYGFCADVVESPRLAPFSDLGKLYNVKGGFTVLGDTTGEEILEFMTSMWVTVLLLAGAIICGYIEFHTPGFGIFGTLSIICLALLLGSRFLTGYAHWWEITLVVLGLILLAVEIFLTPGFGVAGTLGIISLLVGLAAALIPNAPNKLPWPETTLDWWAMTRAAETLLLAFVVAVGSVLLLARFLPKMPVAHWLILQASKALPAAQAEDLLRGVRSLTPGRTGVVTSICRPAGTVRFGEDLVEAVSEGEYIPAGTKVKVVRNEGNRVVVTRA